MLEQEIGDVLGDGGIPVRFAAVGDPHLLSVDDPPEAPKSKRINGCKWLKRCLLVALLHGSGLGATHVAACSKHSTVHTSTQKRGR